MNFHEELQTLEIEKKKLEIAKLKEGNNTIYDIIDQIDVLSNLLDIKIIDPEKEFSENPYKNCFDDDDMHVIRQKIMGLICDLP